MTDRAALLMDLVERCEKAAGPDQELDLVICRRVMNSEPLGHAAGLPDEALKDCISSLLVPRYTASLDAAMSLVPEGWVWRVGKTGWAHLIGDREVWTDAATPALALCAASLGALASEARDE